MATSAPTFASARKRSSSASACGGGAPSTLAEHEHRSGLTDAERPQPHGQLLVRQPSGERLREHVAGEPALGVPHRALAHQLERHDGHGLLEDQPLEVSEATGVARRHQPGLRGASAAQRHGQHQRAARDVRMVRRELGVLDRPRVAVRELLAPARHLLAHLLHRLPGKLAPERLRGDRLAAAGEHAHRAARRGGQRAHHLVEPALLEHQPLEPLVDRDAALEHLVLLVHEAREGLLGERDERQLVRHLEDREVELRRLVHQRGGKRLVVEAGPEPEPGQVVPREQPHELALALVGVELDPGRQQELAARQPRRRVGQLRDVHPANRRVRAVLARRELEPHLGREPSYGEHGISGGRSGPTPR